MPLPSLLSSCVQLAHSPTVPMDHEIDILALGVLGKGRRGALGLLPKPLTDPETLLWQMSPKPTANDVHAQEGSCGWPGSWLSSGDGLMRVCLGGGGAGGWGWGVKRHPGPDSQECPGKVQAIIYKAAGCWLPLTSLVAGLPLQHPFLKMPTVGDIYQIKCSLVLFPQHIDNSLCR